MTTQSTVQRTSSRRRRLQLRRLDGWTVLMVVPPLALFGLFGIWPLVATFGNSFVQWDGLSPKVFVGLANYIAVLTTSTTWSTLGHTFLYAIGTAVAKVALGLLIALLVARSTRGTAIFRSILFVPVLMSFVAVGVLWQFVLDPNQGLLNGALGAVGLPDSTAWLGEPGLSLLSVMGVDVWKWLGYHVVLFVAGLQAVRPELYEAAKTDGASPVQLFRHITVPSLRTMIGLNLVIAVAGALNVFDLVYVMTQGGPSGSSDTVMTFLYRQAFNNQQYGFASALAMLLFLFVGAVTLLQLRTLRSDYNR